MRKEKPEKAPKTLHLEIADSCASRSFISSRSKIFICRLVVKLDPENRWVKLDAVIPWHVAEKMYAKKFMSKRGAPALTVRMALGSLIIKEKLGLSDIETVEQIKESPYLQCFIGLAEYQHTAPFDASMMTHFRKRLKHTDLAPLQ